MQDKVISDDLSQDHFSASDETPLRTDAFELSDEVKIERIANNFKEIMQTLGLDLSDASLRGTPMRVAKMFVNESFSGLNPKNFPSISLFENNFKYDEMLIEKDIEFFSYCEHHFVPIIGKAHVAYYANGKVIGLSKINRIVNYYARRPQVQERMTVQIAKALKKALQIEDVAIVIDADHLCVSSRGVQDSTSSTITASYHGKFTSEERKLEFLKLIRA